MKLRLNGIATFLILAAQSIGCTFPHGDRIVGRELMQLTCASEVRHGKEKAVGIVRDYKLQGAVQTYSTRSNKTIDAVKLDDILVAEHWRTWSENLVVFELVINPKADTTISQSAIKFNGHPSDLLLLKNDIGSCVYSSREGQIDGWRQLLARGSDPNIQEVLYQSKDCEWRKDLDSILLKSDVETMLLVAFDERNKSNGELRISLPDRELKLRFRAD